MTYQKAIALFRQERGMCWICGCPMLPPKERPDGGTPGRWECNIDHIGVKNGQTRETRGAHLFCNCMRQHDDPASMRSHIKRVRCEFERLSFVNGMFTDEINQRIADILRMPPCRTVA